MSASNALLAKRERRRERVERKRAASVHIPFHGVRTTKKIVMGQRYLALIGLPFDHVVAAVPIDGQ